MSEPFFIETSEGIINRSEIVCIDNYDRFTNTPSISISMSNNSIILRGEEARMFLLAIPVKLIVGKADFEEVRNFNREDFENDQEADILTEEEEDTIPF